MLFGARFDPGSPPNVDPANLAKFLEPSPECSSRVGSMLEADGVKVRRLFTTAFSVAASTAPVIRIRAPAANSISIAPPAGSTGPGVALGTCIAGMTLVR